MLSEIEEALNNLPKKGSTEFPCAGWLVEKNLHDWAMELGYLTGCIFKKTKGKGPYAKLHYKLLLVGTCPWQSVNVRFYTASVKHCW